MSERRIFLYQGDVDEAYKRAAKESLAEGGWKPIQEIDDPGQLLTCTGPQRQSCLSGDSFAYGIIAERG